MSGKSPDIIEKWCVSSFESMHLASLEQRPPGNRKGRIFRRLTGGPASSAVAGNRVGVLPGFGSAGGEKSQGRLRTGGMSGGVEPVMPDLLTFGALTPAGLNWSSRDQRSHQWACSGRETILIFKRKRALVL